MRQENNLILNCTYTILAWTKYQFAEKWIMLHNMYITWKQQILLKKVVWIKNVIFADVCKYCEADAFSFKAIQFFEISNESNENQVHIKINIIFEDPEATFYYLFPNFEGSGQCKQTYSVQHKKQKVYFMKVSILCSIYTHISSESKVGDPLKVVCSLLIYCPKRLLHTATSQEIN